MTKVWAKLAALLCGLLVAMLVILVSIPFTPHEYNLFADYADYLPLADGYKALGEVCSVTHDYYDYLSNSADVICRFNDGVVNMIAFTMNKQGQIERAYIYPHRCEVTAALLLLSTDVRIEVVAYGQRKVHNSRRLVFETGRSYAFVRRGKVYTPYACIWGIYISGV